MFHLVVRRGYKLSVVLRRFGQIHICHCHYSPIPNFENNTARNLAATRAASYLANNFETAEVFAVHGRYDTKNRNLA